MTILHSKHRSKLALGGFTSSLLRSMVISSAAISMLHAETVAPPTAVKLAAPDALKPSFREAAEPEDNGATSGDLYTSSNAAISGSETTWTENAEGGAGNVIDGTDAGYSLIQSARVAEGSNAFHLANPNFADNSFTLNVNIDVQADTKLFFQSRLQYATDKQIAKVQRSIAVDEDDAFVID